MNIMQTKIATGLVMIICVLGSFDLAYSDESDSSVFARGAELYSYNCTRCHNPRPADDYTAKGWSVVMPHMREKAHMTRDETIAVETFLSSTLTADKLIGQIGSLSEQATGEELIAQFGCQGCHQIDGAGGTLGPILGSITAAKGSDFISMKLREPTFNNPASSMPKYPISDAQIETIVNFLTRD